MTKTDANEERVTTSLADWSRAIDRAIDAGANMVAALMAEAVLGQLPRHLPTYTRMLQICWRLERWSEGEEWARRLLQADPGNPLAWRALAMAAEVEERRGQANVIWRRAFEMSPFDPDIRAGLYRTSLEPPNALTFNLACLAALHLRGGHWHVGAENYRQLVQADHRRVDFQVCLMVALWQAGKEDEAYTLARHLVQRHPHLLMAWHALAALGDENDQALAVNPVATMDPDYEFAATFWHIGLQNKDYAIRVTEADMSLLDYRLPVRSPENST